MGPPPTMVFSSSCRDPGLPRVAYGAPARLESDAVVDVLTPPSTVAALKGGYKPLWVESLKASR